MAQRRHNASVSSPLLDDGEETSPAVATTDTSDAAAQAKATEMPSLLGQLGMMAAFLVIPGAIDVAIACIFYFPAAFKASADDNITTLSQYHLQWLCINLYILVRLTGMLNFFPTMFKSEAVAALQKEGTKTGRVNPYVYEVNSSKEMVGFIDDGVAGMYNRAQRSLHHYIENLPGLLMALPIVSYVFPMQACVAVCVFAVGRIWHMLGYSRGGYGAHAPGFMLSMLAKGVVEGLLLIAGIQGFRLA